MREQVSIIKEVFMRCQKPGPKHKNKKSTRRKLRGVPPKGRRRKYPKIFSPFPRKEVENIVLHERAD